jgi:hypothetical protein
MGRIVISEIVSLDGVAQDLSTVSRRSRLDRRRTEARTEATAGLSAPAPATGRDADPAKESPPRDPVAPCSRLARQMTPPESSMDEK